VLTFTYFVSCLIGVDKHKFKINFRRLSLKDLDTILRINWLSTNFIPINYGQKKVPYPDHDEMKPISKPIGVVWCEQVSQLLCDLHLIRSEYKYLGRILVVKDFMDVFPKEVPWLPAEREVKFYVDLVSGVGLMFITS